MSKQTTLFSTWGTQAKQTQPPPQDHPPSVNDQFDCDDGDFGLTERDLEELCRAEETATSSHSSKNSGSFHIGPSHAFVNSSIIEEGIPGFDEEAGQLWIYPTNYPLRDYQYNIVHKALFTNTLVCLPTGLGKTFIAAVVMYNFYRWYPNGKIVFLAPTKPLVTQQIEACHNVMGIPQEHTSEMTGHLSPKMRASLWQQKRVFFLTPQVMQNDLLKGTCPALDVCCVVFDEAHKALGNHAYCQVVKELSKSKVRFRVLALSATPGNDLRAVQQVVTNLQVGHIELRSEDSLDIQRYVNERKVEKIVVPLEGEITDVKKCFVTILGGVLSRLVRYKVFYQTSPDRLTKYQLLQAREQFRAAGPPAGVLPGAVEGDFALAISLFHAYELLLQHGMRSFYQFLATTFSAGGTQSRAKGEVLRSSQFKSIMSGLGERVAASAVRESLTDGPSFPRRDGGHGKVEGGVSGREFFYSHPKLRRLEDVVLKHFRQFQSDSTAHTRVMIFSQYRDSVQEIADMLDRHTPLVRVMTFVGHSTGKSSSKGLSQREQTEIVRKFREGGYNTLVATCVGEEGLDIGDVDLIVCFDAPKSPIRLVQRMGRTGRKRKGRIVMILAEGKEDQGYNKSQSNKKSIHRAICNSCKSLTFYQYCHRMVPKHLHPQVHKMHMSVEEFVSSKETKKDTKNVLRWNSVLNQGLVKSKSHGKKVKKGTYLSDQELNCWSEGLSLTDREFTAIKKSVHNCFTPSPLLCVPNSTPSPHSMNTSLNVSKTTASFALSLDNWISDQVVRMPPRIIESSRTCENFISTLEFIDMLRTSEGMGQSYDLEMRTYLNHDDIKPMDHSKVNRDTSERDRQPNSSASTSPPPTRKKGMKRKRLISESDDEDFVKDHRSSSTSNEHTSTSTVSPKTDNKEASTSTPKEGLSGINGSNPPAVERSSRISLTQSGHVVPRAPSGDDLDWLDDLEPSQVSTTFTRTPSFLKGHKKQAESPNMDFCEDFKTPILPVSKSKLQPHKCSTPASLTGVDSSTRMGCDLFDSLPAHAIFDDFSSSCLDDHNCMSQSNKRTSGGTKLPSVRQSIRTYSTQLEVPREIEPNAEDKPDVIELPSDSDDAAQEQVCIIEESDLENEPCDMPSGLVVPDTPLLFTDKEEQNVPTTPQSEEEANLNNDSSLNIVRKFHKRPLKNRNSFLFQSELEDEPTGMRCDANLSETCSHSDRNVNLPTTPLSEEKANLTNSTEDSFLNIVRKCRKRPLKNRNAFLQSPDTPGTATISPGSKENNPVISSNTTPNISRCRKRIKVTFDCDSSGDEFDMNPRKSKKKSARKTLSSKTVSSKPSTKCQNKVMDEPNEFIEEEAEVSDDVHTRTESDQLSEEYDCDDSFINDNSMLTQFSPSQRIATTRTPKKMSKSDANSNNLYLRSLMSPEDHLFAGRRRGGEGRYRMVLSQRHELLNHYMNKAGFKADQRKPKRHECEDGDLFETDSNGSEAEEVNCLEEECEDSAGADHLNESYSEVSPLPVKRRRAAFLSDSEPSFVEDLVDHSSPAERMREEQPLSAVGQCESACDEVIISPSLLASIKVRPTPSCFSIGMDDWVDWSELSD